jgi:uncharacterized protein
VLVDAGPLVALIDGSDAAHQACVTYAKTLREPLATVWPAFTEAMYLLDFSLQAQQHLWALVENDALHFAHLTARDAPLVRELMTRYRDQPMDLADAALVHVAERDGLKEIFTLDRRHFGVYRLSGRRKLTLRP